MDEITRRMARIEALLSEETLKPEVLKSKDE